MAATYRVEYVRPSPIPDGRGNVDMAATRYVSPDMEPADAQAYAQLVALNPDATEIVVLSR